MSTIKRSKAYFWGLSVPDDYLESVDQKTGRKAADQAGILVH